MILKRILDCVCSKIQEDGLLTDGVGTNYGKPNLKPIPDSTTSLTQMVGPGSNKFFEVLNCTQTFLNVRLFDGKKTATI